MKKFTQVIVALFAILTIVCAAQAAEPEATAYGRITKSNLPPLPADFQDPKQSEPTVPLSERYLVKPILETPMRAPSICKGPDGTFYLTGTSSGTTPDGTPDFDKGGVIRLWKSADLKTWSDLGVVFDPKKAGGKTISQASPGAISPEIHYLKNTFWIPFSMNGEGTALLKSSSGKAEGPYELMGKDGDFTITSVGNDPSLFQDDDGSVYWLWSPAWIAKMNDDMTGLAETPRLLTCASREALNSDVLVGRRGPFLWKAKGIYHLAASDTLNRLAIHLDDTLVATSKTLFGVYSKRLIMIPHGGQTTVFQDAKGNYQATYCGNDRFAAFRDKAGIVPLEWMTGWRYLFSEPAGVLRANQNKVYTERGPWHKLLPLFEAKGFYLRDHHVMQAPDGYFYVSGSVHGDPYVGKLPIYRSRDLKEWEEIIVRTFDDEPWPEAKRKHRIVTKDGKTNVVAWNQYYMSTAINWVPKLKTFVISFDAWNDCPPKPTDQASRANGWLISTSGKGEGPYEVMPKGCLNNCAKLFEDDNADLFFCWGNQGLNRLNDDFSIKQKLPDVYPAAGGEPAEDCECCMVKMHGKYVFMNCTEGKLKRTGMPASCYSYGHSYMTADSPTGPWSKMMPEIRHCAWGTPFRGLDGHWYASTFGTALLGSFMLKPSIVRLTTELKDGQLLIDIDPDWTPADYVPVTEWKGEGDFSPYTDTLKGPPAKK